MTDRSFFTPGRLIGAVALLVLIAALLSPGSADLGTPFSSNTASGFGTLALYQTFQRLGYHVQRGTRPLSDSAASPIASREVLFLLNPSQPLTVLDRNAVIRAARNGATLVTTATDGDLTDSLHFSLDELPGRFHPLSGSLVLGGNLPVAEDPASIDGYSISAYPLSSRVLSSPKQDDQALMWLWDAERDSTRADSTHVHDGSPHTSHAAGEHATSEDVNAVILGHSYGKGYVIEIGTAALVTNQLMYDRRAAVAIVRGIEASGATTDWPVVFDEYHHGYGNHSNLTGAIADAMTDTPMGRTALQGIAAALVLLLAYAVRPLAPLPAVMISRRSPLEHVGALANAYQQAGARKLGTNRLVQGLRRRHTLGVARSVSDTVYLATLRSRAPAATEDIDRVAAALGADSSGQSGQSGQSGELANIGSAIANIERVFKE